jgi:hypothetical protein
LPARARRTCIPDIAILHEVSSMRMACETRHPPLARGVYGCGVYSANLSAELGEKSPPAGMAPGPRSS